MGLPHLFLGPAKAGHTCREERESERAKGGIRLVRQRRKFKVCFDVASQQLMNLGSSSQLTQVLRRSESIFIECKDSEEK